MKWIKVSERLPEKGKLVFVIAQNTYRLICQLSASGSFHEVGGNIDIRNNWKPEEIEWIDELEYMNESDVDLMAEALVSYQHTLISYLTWKNDEYSQKMIPIKIKEVLSLYSKIRL